MTESAQDEIVLTQEDKDLIYYTLLHLGSVGWTKACTRMISAMEYVLVHDISNMQVSSLCVDIGKEHRVTWLAVERSLRCCIKRMWRLHHQECVNLFYHTHVLIPIPSTSDFLFMFKKEFQNGNIRRWHESFMNSTCIT